MTPPYSAYAVAQYLLTKADPDAGDALSNLALQKLLYYAQGLHLGLYESPLFPEPIEAWMYGPAVPAVYARYQSDAPAALWPDPHFFCESLDEESRDFLDEVYQVYGQFATWTLRALTAIEPPYRDTPLGEVISLTALQRYFVTRIIQPEDTPAASCSPVPTPTLHL